MQFRSLDEAPDSSRHVLDTLRQPAGRGDRPETANQITLDDLVAVTLLSVDVPGDVALQLLEGNLGPDITRHLQPIPTNVSIKDPPAAELFATLSHVARCAAA